MQGRCAAESSRAGGHTPSAPPTTSNNNGLQPLTLVTTSTQAPSAISSTPSAVTPQSSSSAPAPRKVRTVPPSARLDPPTPPAVSNPTFDTARIELPKRRRRRFRSYWSSDDDSSDDESGIDDDDEPPWWTFTNRGMNKLRSRDQQRHIRSSEAHAAATDNDDTAPGTEAESGRDSVRLRPKKKRTLAFHPTPPRQDSGGSTPPTRAAQAASRLFHPRPLRTSWTRRSSEMNREMSRDMAEAAEGHQMARPSSAPIPDEPTTGATRRPVAPVGSDTDTPQPSPTRRPTIQRFLSMPRRHSHDDATLTDPEATIPGTSPRLRAKQRLFTTLGSVTSPPLAEEGTHPESDTAAAPSSGGRPKVRRLNTHNLRIRLPAPVSEHFAGGWPHAGSWQDALRYGVLEDDKDGSLRRHSYDQGGVMSSVVVEEPERLGSSIRDRSGANTPARPRSLVEQPAAMHHQQLKQAKRRKSKARRSRRYRPAMVPPTPGGESLTIGNGHRVIGADAWGENAMPTPDPETNPFDRVNPFDRIDDELSPSETRVSEKGRFRRRRNKRRNDDNPVDGLGWRKRLRRMLFLDARITIWIRLMNIAIAVTLLALGVTTRNKMNSLELAGVIGPSTTLIIAYSCLTIVHVLTATYREYFGRPIGLWGLRSKMLWVCLDLLFIALWASASTLAINDYIDTPIDCSPGAPWWSHNLDFFSTAETEAPGFERDAPIPDWIKAQPAVRDLCRRQAGCFAVSLVALLVYCVNMVLSLFRIFETVRRTCNPIRTVSV